ncbi:MAG TPA: hypothetical protein VKX28_06630 [Xanthobacteraceae bacterium]|nr:hypothetical protein [Xanthobacteraceae bacterium]
MGAWGIGLYAGDFAHDLRAVVTAVSRVPLDEDAMVQAVCDSEASAAEDPADEDHAVFWLVLADQFEKRGIFSARVRDTALAIIDGGEDGAMMQKLGMKPLDLRKRAAKLAELRARLVAQPAVSKPRTTMKRPVPYVFEVGGVYAYPTRGGDVINPYLGPKHFDRAAWHPDGFGLMLVIGRGSAFGYLPWYQAVVSREVFPAIPDRHALPSENRWSLPVYGSCDPAQFRKMELAEVGVFPIDPARVDRFFPHLAPGTSYAVEGITIANRMNITPAPERDRRWRRPDGKLERIVYPPRPTIAELMQTAD